MRIRHLASAALVLAVGTTATAVPASASASASAESSAAAPAARAASKVKTKKACNPQRYKVRHTLESLTTEPVITHINTVGISPGNGQRITEKVFFNRRAVTTINLDARVSVKTGALGSLAAKASAEVGVGFRRTTGKTKKTTSKVTTTVSNPTKSNKQFVFYKGATQAKGRFREYRCDAYYASPDSTNVYFRVTYYPGTWKSYAIAGSGALRCGGGTKGLGELAKAALRIGCKA